MSISRPPVIRSILAIAIALCVVALVAPSSDAKTVRVAGMSLGDPEFGPTLGDGYVYWVDTKFIKKSEGGVVSSVFQLRISDGRKRLVFRKKRAVVETMFAEGDAMAFSVMSVARKLGRSQTGLIRDEIYGMAAEEASARIVSSQLSKVIVSKTTRHVHGEKRITTVVNVCGGFADLFDVTAKGEVLLNERATSCDSNKTTSKGQIFSLSGAPSIPVPSLEESYFASLQYGKLVTTPFNTIGVRDLATGQIKHYRGYVLPDQAVFDEAGDLLTVNTTHSKALHRLVTEIKFYPPGASKAATTLTRPWLDFSSVVYCAGGFVELSEPMKGPMLVTLRAFDGSVIQRIDGPRTGLGYDATCTGRHLTLATVKGSGTPAILNYDF